jgi:hypothetical protein
MNKHDSLILAAAICLAAPLTQAGNHGYGYGYDSVPRYRPGPYITVALEIPG